MNTTERLLSDIEFQLVVLAAHETSGRDLAEKYRASTGKELPYGTLYTTLRRLKEQGFVRVSDSEDEDGRFRLFKATGPGLRAASITRDRFQALGAFGLGSAK